MDNMEREEMQREKRRLVVMGIIIAVLILAVIVGSIIMIAVNSGNDSGGKTVSDEDDGFSLNNQMFYDDIYSGKRLIPKFNAPTNDYDMEKYTSVNGIINYDSPDATLGIDVSSFQGQIDWAQVKASGIEFAMIRVGNRGYTEGGVFLDERFDENIQGALDNGIKVGAYFFSSAISESEAKEEADFVAKHLKDYDITYPVVFDWEYQARSESARTHSSTGEDVSQYAKAFCDEIKKKGYIPMFYTNKTMGYDTFDLELLKEYDMWYAEYQPKPSFYYHFDMWQFTDSGTISGVPESVDINICFKKY